MRSLVQYNRFVCSIKSVVQYNRLFHKIVCKKLSYSQKFVWKILRSVKIKIAFHICLLTDWLRHSMRPIVYNFISLFFVNLKKNEFFSWLLNDPICSFFWTTLSFTKKFCSFRNISFVHKTYAPTVHAYKKSDLVYSRPMCKFM